MKILVSISSVADTIRNQIRAIDRNALMAWGAKEFVGTKNPCLPEKQIGEGLQFRVNGSKHKGYIIVLLAPNDLYNIFAYKIVKLNVKVVKRVNGVFVEDLVRALDEIIG